MAHFYPDKARIAINPSPGALVSPLLIWCKCFCCNSGTEMKYGLRKQEVGKW